MSPLRFLQFTATSTCTVLLLHFLASNQVYAKCRPTSCHFVFQSTSFFFFLIANYLITTRKGFTVIFRLKDEILALWSEPALGEVRKAKNSARSLEFYSKAQANKVIKLFIIWLQIGKAHEIKRTSGEFTWRQCCQICESEVRSPETENYFASATCLFGDHYIWQIQMISMLHWKSCSREQLDDKIKTSDAFIWKARVETKRSLKVLNLTKNMHACVQLNFTQQFIIPYLTLCHSWLSSCVVFHPQKSLTRWRLGIDSC